MSLPANFDRNLSLSRPTLHTELDPESDLSALKVPRQQQFNFESPEPPTVPPDRESFAELTGRSLMLGEEFQYLLPQIRTIMHLDSSNRDTIVAAPTGSGKTFMALAYLAKELSKAEGKAAVLTRQVKLVDQICRDAEGVLELNEGEKVQVTGRTDPAARKDLYDRPHAKLFCATPHVICSDLKQPRPGDLFSPGTEAGQLSEHLNLKDLREIFLDEVHQTKGDDPYSKFLNYVKEHDIDVRLIGVSATPARNKKELEELKARFRTEPECIRFELTPWPKKFPSHPVTIPPSIRVKARPLEDAIQSCHSRVVEMVQRLNVPELEPVALELLTRVGRDLATARESRTKGFVRQISSLPYPKAQEAEPDDIYKERIKELKRERTNLIEHVYTLGALGRYHRYLVTTGVFFFLDRLGREIVDAEVTRAKNDHGKQVSAMFVRSKDSQNWFFQMLFRNPELRGYRLQLRETFKAFSQGTQYEGILYAKSLRELAESTPGISHEGVKILAEHRGVGLPKGPYKRISALKNAVFDEMRKDLAQRDDWYDGPATEKVIDLVREHVRRERAGSVLVETKFYHDAVFMSEVIKRRLREFGVKSGEAAGSRYMSERDVNLSIEKTAVGEFQVLVATEFLQEGHNIRGSNTLIAKHQPGRVDGFMQLIGRAGRYGVAHIHSIYLPITEQKYLSNLRGMKLIRKFLEENFKKVD